MRWGSGETALHFWLGKGASVMVFSRRLAAFLILKNIIDNNIEVRSQYKNYIKRVMVIVLPLSGFSDILNRHNLKLILFVNNELKHKPQTNTSHV